MEKKELKILIIMRHGERIDCPDNVNNDEKRWSSNFKKIRY